MAITAKKIPKNFFSHFTSIFIAIFAPIIAPNIPDIPIVIPIFQSINFSLIETIIAVIEVGTKNTKFVA